VVLTSNIGEHSPRLVRAASDGRSMDVEVLIPPDAQLKLTGAIVSSYQRSGEGEPEAVETWTLDAQSIERTSGAGEGAKP
jgi:hypothetical protein